MAYYIDLNKISLDDYKKNLETAYLVPSRVVLKENINIRFEALQKCGFNNLAELQKVFKNKDKLKEIAIKCAIPEDYLVILNREINSINPKPNKFSEFPGISVEIVKMLEKEGIKDTSKFFDRALSPSNRKELSEKTGISEKEILELTKLTDLSRIKWVGATFARLLYESGYDTVEKVANSHFEELYKAIRKTNELKQLYKGQIGLNDMKICIQAAKEVTLEIEY